MTLTLAARPEPQASPAEDPFAPLRRRIDDRKRAMASAEAKCATLAANDAELCKAITENRRIAAQPQPDAGAFPTVDEWHAAVTKWRTDHADIDQVHSRLARERTQLVGRQIPELQGITAALRTEVRKLEVELAWAEHKAAKDHADELERRARRLQGAAWAAQTV